jgi:hypothetical protein
LSADKTTFASLDDSAKQLDTVDLPQRITRALVAAKMDRKIDFVFK